MTNPLTYEPAMTVGFTASLLAAVAAVLRAFNVYDLTDEQTAAVLAILTALAPVVGFAVRQKVTPTARVHTEVRAAVREALREKE